jgi:hypothetical protein
MVALGCDLRLTAQKCFLPTADRHGCRAILRRFVSRMRRDLSPCSSRGHQQSLGSCHRIGIENLGTKAVRYLRPRDERRAASSHILRSRMHVRDCRPSTGLGWHQYRSSAGARYLRRSSAAGTDCWLSPAARHRRRCGIRTAGGGLPLRHSRAEPRDPGSPPGQGGRTKPVTRDPGTLDRARHYRYRLAVQRGGPGSRVRARRG